MIHLYNLHQEDHSANRNNYYIGRGSPLGNPFTHNGVRTSLAKLSFKTREEAIAAYEVWFDEQYGVNKELTEYFDEIYEKYKNGEDVYLGCYCRPLSCHGEIIEKSLQNRLIKEKMLERKK
jgi:hypothetical protein